ncbi:MAG: ATP-binding protein [Oscillospiraceae bacterium]|nr:ATP-binding protein [Oscillospiraceae bacterium]
MDYKPLPIGVENFDDMITNGYYYIDKTMFIKELIDKKGTVNLFTRPRRFGKTLNLSMLEYFFDITKKESSHIFDGLNIMSAGEAYTSEMNQYPVIKLSLKSAEQSTFEASFRSLKKDIIREFGRNEFICESDLVPAYNKNAFKKLLYGEVDDIEYYDSLKLLSECLHAHYNKKVIVLIDEYDVPLEKAHVNGYYPQMLEFVRSFLHSGLKTNNALHFAVMTGCLRVSKESIFTGLNNPVVISILSSEYGEYFGFTQEEVSAAFEYFGLERKLQEAHDWYNGYVFGNVNVYNPWSIIRYMRDLRNDENWFPRAYWANTSSNEIIRELVDVADRSIKADIEALMNGGSITKQVVEEVTYSEILGKSDNVWSFLLFTGYLKKIGEDFIESKIHVKLEIPNIEVQTIYRDKISEWFSDRVRSTDLSAIYSAIIDGDAKKLTEELSTMLADTISYHDSHESFYHGFLIGVLASMKDYLVKSNRESGSGRGDIFIIPDLLEKKAVIMELKVADKASDMERESISALKQIDEKGYIDELEQIGYKNILKYGISFYRKNCLVTVVDMQ